MSTKRTLKTAMRNAYWWLWFHVWIDEDEFHSSLELDVDAMVKMSPEKREKYYSTIAYIRSRAHQMDSYDKKLNLHLKKKLFTTIIVIIVSFILATGLTSIVYVGVGIRENISIILFGSFISFVLLFSTIISNPTSCCITNKN
jgi:hypothetical protein